MFTPTTSWPDRLRKQQLNLPTNGIGTTTVQNLLYSLANTADWIIGERQPLESRTNQSRDAGKLCQMVESVAAIDHACDQDRMMREHFCQMGRFADSNSIPWNQPAIFKLS